MSDSIDYGDIIQGMARAIARLCICGHVHTEHDMEGEFVEGSWQMHYGACEAIISDLVTGKLSHCRCEGFEEA